MIILSGVLVVVAIALLVAGIVGGSGESAQVLGLDALVVIYVSIAVSIVSALCLSIGVFLRRKELFGPGASAATAKKTRRPGTTKAKGRKKTERPVPAAGRAKTPAAPAADDDAVEIPPQPAEVPDAAVVYVVRGRKRYHLDTCRQLAGRDRDELTYAEAKEEGFSSCTACMPDTALAARAAVSVPAGPGARPADAGTATAKTIESKAVAAEPAGSETADSRTAEVPAPSPEPPVEAGSGHASSATAAFPPAWPTPGATPPETAADIPAGAPSSATAAGDPVPDDGDDVLVRILSGTKRYHRVECALIEDIGDDTEDLESLTRAEAKSRGCTPCLVCQPDRLSA
ncbi:hypothetical protein GCM10010191_15270 [Actinomadura vinacea]|uniref:Uncharacterized protein n=1 Tax=Actinomadura vinacea TaxID=115336 RepID=A0ABN3IKZ2_9ACTN